MDCVYDRVVAIYSRTYQGDLVRCFGKHAVLLQRNWRTIRQKLSTNDLISYRLVSGITLDEPEFQSKMIYAHEVPMPNGPLGFLLPESRTSSTADFDEYFCRLLLSHANESFDLHKNPQVTKDTSIAERLVELFNQELLVQPPNSQFEIGGRSYLQQGIEQYTSRDLPIKMCLPAFPCKSSNLEKVAGVLPDRGEELALRRLYAVLRQIESIYKPGARLCIISDGHVFSDCIGVDDDQVDEYGRRLQELNQTIGSQEAQINQITFKSLKDIFNLSPKDILKEAKVSRIHLPTMNHFLDTKISPDTEFCRQAMTLACQPNQETLRSQIKNQDPAILSLYRGFSRFMLEDLALHPKSQTMTRSQRKKVSEKTSFEMILRNQAYSNLVELCLPDYVRLSIHAHINSGPKFGITLFDRAKTRAIDDLHDLASIVKPSHDLLHIPTPWHNCVVQVTGSDSTYVTKAKVVRDALDAGYVSGCWVQGDLSRGVGGYFQIDAPKTVETEVKAFSKPVVPSICELDLRTLQGNQISWEESSNCFTAIIDGFKRLGRWFKPRLLRPQTEKVKAVD